jgi:hypothetical protein
MPLLLLLMPFSPLLLIIDIIDASTLMPLFMILILLIIIDAIIIADADY